MSTLLDALAAATQADLDAVDKLIAEKTKELEVLETARRVLDVKLNGRKQRKSPTKRDKTVPTTSGSTMQTAMRVAVDRENLIRHMIIHLYHSGRATTTAMAEALKVPGGDLLALLPHEYFSKVAHGNGTWTLTEEGRAAARLAMKASVAS